MIGEPDAGKLHVRFDEGMQETCGSATRLCPTLRAARSAPRKFFWRADASTHFGHCPWRIGKNSAALYARRYPVSVILSGSEITSRPH
jgi:hypothetical protein